MKNVQEMPKTAKGGKVGKVAANNVSEAVNASNTTEVKISPREIYRQKMAETKQAFQAVEQSIVDELGVKVVTLKNGTTKEVAPSKTLIRAKANIEYLRAVESRTITETKRLLSSLSKVDKMSASRVYEYVFKIVSGLAGGENAEELQAVALELFGSTKENFPTFKVFAAELPIKFAYSESDGWNVLAKFNKASQLALKVAKQNAATAKK